MRSFIITSLLFTIMIFSITANAIYVSRTADKIKEYVEGEEFEKAPEASMTALESLWEDNRIILELSVGYKEMDLISELILDLKHYVNINNTEETKRIRTLIADAADDISRLERLSLESLF